MAPIEADPTWRRMQWILIVVWIGLFTILIGADGMQPKTEAHTPLAVSAGFLTILAQGLWITFDAKALKRRVGGWRFAAFLVGPLALWPYMVYTYRLRGFLMIPLSIAVYLAPVGLLAIAERIHLIPGSLFARG